MPSQIQNDRSTRRMRLGTKSCSECRRRKVRCIVPEGEKSCQECTAHSVACTPQSASKSIVEPRTIPEVQARLDHLVGLFHLICKTVDANLEPVAQVEFESATQKILGRLRSEPSPSWPSLGGNILQPSPVSPSSPSQGINSHHSDEIEQPQHAPLVGFVRDSLMIADPISRSDVSTARTGANSFSLSHKKRLEALVPQPTVLTTILQHTQKYWALWPLHPIQLSNSDGMSISPVSVARTFVMESICSDSPATAAKALVWLALCLQQFPKARHDLLVDLPSAAVDLVLIYLKESDTLMALESDSGVSIPALESLVLQMKCYTNMGRPRKAWTSVRRALNEALLLGLHQPATPPNIAHQNLWSTIWRYDRHLSLILGFPHGISEPHPTLLESESDVTVESRVMHHMSIASGHIIERNQNYQNTSYSSTMMIDEEMETVKRMIPSCWWEPHCGNAPFALLFGRQSTKLFFYQLKALIHLPYMVKASMDMKYDYSRNSVLGAVEGIIQSYRETRQLPDGPAVTCFLMDFHAFSAGLILATDLISQRSNWEAILEEKKWDMILGLITDLKQTSTLLGYPVAEKAAQLLEYMYAARHGIYDGPEIYEATVPYYGKVCIRRPASQTSELSQLSTDLYPAQDIWNSVELSSNMFNYQTTLPCQPEVELDMDWSTFLSENITFDWHGVFEFKGTNDT